MFIKFLINKIKKKEKKSNKGISNFANENMLFLIWLQTPHFLHLQHEQMTCTRKTALLASIPTYHWTYQ